MPVTCTHSVYWPSRRAVSETYGGAVEQVEIDQYTRYSDIKQINQIIIYDVDLVCFDRFFTGKS